MRSTTRAIATLLFAGLFVAACGGAGATLTTPPVTAPPATPTAAAPTPTLGPTATPVPTTDAQGPEHFTGVMTTQPSLITAYTTTTVGNVDQLRGGEVEFTFRATDARMTGTATMKFSADVYDGVVAPEWGTFELTSAGGSWSGSFTAATWEAGDRIVLSCWLVGAGGYAGSTAYFSLQRPTADPGVIEGIIYPGAAPRL